MKEGTGTALVNFIYDCNFYVNKNNNNYGTCAILKCVALVHDDYTEKVEWEPVGTKTLILNYKVYNSKCYQNL